MPTILVTGASRGIGAYLCRHLHDAGHRVFAGVRDPEVHTSLHDLVESDRLRVLHLDVRRESDPFRAVADIMEEVDRIDVLINNAGVAWLAPIELQTESVLRRTMETNFFGALRMTRAVLPIMRRQRGGKIINISSLAAFHGLPAEAAYCASKSALDVASQSLALEVERFGISVTSIRPGYTATGLATSSVAEDVSRRTVYEPLLEHLELLYRRSAESAESPDLVAAAVEEVIASDRPAPLVELGDLSAAVAVVRRGGPTERLDAMRAVHAMEWWRSGAPAYGGEEA